MVEITAGGADHGIRIFRHADRLSLYAAVLWTGYETALPLGTHTSCLLPDVISFAAAVCRAPEAYEHFGAFHDWYPNVCHIRFSQSARARQWNEIAAARLPDLGFL